MDSLDVELWSAARTVDMHAAGGGCAQCPTDGGECRLYGWAAARLAVWEHEHGTRYPQGRAPDWSQVRPCRGRAG